MTAACGLCFFRNHKNQIIHMWETLSDVATQNTLISLRVLYWSLSSFLRRVQRNYSRGFAHV